MSDDTTEWVTLMRGETRLGRLTPTEPTDVEGWTQARFEPDLDGFTAELRALFDEAGRLADDERWDRFDAVYKRIDQPPLRLVFADGREATGVVLHLWEDVASYTFDGATAAL